MSKSNKRAKEELIRICGAECWKDIKGYEGIYQVSNTGKVRSVDRRVKDTTKDRYQYLKGKELKQTDNGKGYKLVFLNKNRTRKNKYVHRLVAETFISNPLNLPEVNHKNLNKSDNSIENLEWVTNVENKRHYQKTEKAKEANFKISQKNMQKAQKKALYKTKEIIEMYVNKQTSIISIARTLHLKNENVREILKQNGVELNLRKRNHCNPNRDKNGRFIKNEQ